MKESIKNEISKVVDFQAIRARKSEDKRKRFEFFYLSTEVIAFVVLNDKTAISISKITDFSRDGLSFQVNMTRGLTTEKELSHHLSIRFFLTSNSYIDLPIIIIHESAKKDTMHFGCKIDENSHNYKAYCAWFDFMATYGKCAKRI